MLFSNNSQMILRNCKMFKTKKVFFSGNIQDHLPIYLSTISTTIYFQKHNHYLDFKKINNTKNIKIYNDLLLSQDMIKNIDTIIYYWPKNKSEAKFQLIHLLSLFPIKTEIFIVGENCSGVKSASLILREWIELEIIDNAKHSILILGVLNKKIQFVLESFFKTHAWKNLYIKSLPGVFGHKKIDEGSKLLTSTFSKNITGRVLDVGCGTGFLSVSLLHYSPDLILTLLDNSVAALISTQATLNINKLKGTVILSNLYSNISKKFNLIISNPPFHNDLKTNFDVTKKIIYKSVKYLKLKGELRFVTNSCFSYDFILKKTFKRHFLLKKTNKYKVYQAFLS